MNRMMPARQVASTVIAFALAALGGCVTAPAPVPSPAPPIRAPAPVPSPQQSEPRSARGNPPFYEVLGKRYFVLPSATGYQERGVASWYGPGFHTKQTSNGERFDMYAMTAAHKSLPLPSWVEVTNLRNGRSVTVRVNDRGPFKDGRIIDLSYSAAEKLDMLRDGTTFVEVRALSGAPGAPPEQAAATLNPSAPLFIQWTARQTRTRRFGEQLRAPGYSGRQDTVSRAYRPHRGSRRIRSRARSPRRSRCHRRPLGKRLTESAT
jgi:rare lipoprotein A